MTLHSVTTLPAPGVDPEPPPPSDPSYWIDGAMTVSRFAKDFDVSRKTAFELMKKGRLVWGRMGRQRRISRKSAAELFSGGGDT